jgi:hypothetical protein
MAAKNRKEMTGGSMDFDHQIWDELDKLTQENEIPLREVLESFPIFVRRINLTKLLIYYELFKMSLSLPGDIVECGVYRGNTLCMFAKFFEIFSPANRLNKVIGFDNFKGFESFSVKDGKEVERRGKVIGGWNAGDFKDALIRALEIHTRDSFLPRVPRVELVEGDICKTAKRYVADNPGLRIALLHLNCNLYEPTLAALKAFYPRVVNSGVIVCAEYGMKEWGGESAAIEEYFKGSLPKFQRMPWHNQPTCFFIKEA